jgi:hypothetical protein
VVRAGLAGVPMFEPTALRLSHAGGFHDSDDVLQYLQLKTSGLFSERDWAASAVLCAAQDAKGASRMTLDGDTAVVAVNPDPDLGTMLEMGPNRGVSVLEHIQQSGAAAVWLKTAGTSPGLDYSVRALYLCDYPALWEEGAQVPGVDLRHAEAELIANLACVFKEKGIRLLVDDSGPLAPFTTYHADGLVCASTDPAEMRRQRALAGSRPVLWLAKDADPDAQQLARNLGFVTPLKINEN